MAFVGVTRVVVSGETLAKGCKMSLARSTDSMENEREVCVTQSRCGRGLGKALRLAPTEAANPGKNLIAWVSA